MRSVWMVVVLLVFSSACGGGSRAERPVDAGCTVLGGPTPLALTANDELQIQLEVRFLQLSDSFLDDVGLDFHMVLPTQPVGQPGFGGAFQQRGTYAVPGGVAADVGSADLIVPNGHRPGSYLPTGTVGAAPGVGQGASFVQAPGDDDQCLDIYELLRFPLTGTGNVPATTAIVPNGALGAGLGVAAALLDEAEVGLLLSALSTATDSEGVSAPEVSVFDGQRVISVIQDGQTSASDLLPIVTSEVYGGAAIEFVTSGITLDVRPTVAPAGGAIQLAVRPLSHAVVATLQGTHLVNGTPLTVQVPILVPTTVQTTVSVPDGGTVLLGGLKRLANDGQTGVPLLSRLPYINRLFKSESTLASGRSLMMMITPRIIIQEEEEQR